MLDIECMAKSLQCKWVKLYFNDNQSPWKILFDFNLKKYGGKLLFESNFRKNDVTLNNKFIEGVCYAWSDFNFRPLNVENYWNESVLNNSYIKIDNKLIYSKILHAKSAHYVKNFFDNNGNALQYINFISKFDISNEFPFTFYYGILSAIPHSWRLNIKPNPGLADNYSRLISYTSCNRPTKKAYDYFIMAKLQTPIAIQKWERNTDANYNWSRIFNLPFLAVREAKLQYFQFRFIHRLVATNVFLHKIKCSDSPLCTFCGDEPETLEHLFWSCASSTHFWQSAVFLCLKNPPIMDWELVKFGCVDDLRHPLNFFLLHAKYFIFSCKLDNTKPNAIVFHKKLRFLINVEIYIACKSNDDERSKSFEDTFL